MRPRRPLDHHSEAVRRHRAARPHLAVLGAGLLAIALSFGAAPAFSCEGAENQHLKIVNETSDPVTVYVQHSQPDSSGSYKVQKRETVKAGKSHRFIFEWCNDCCGKDKARRYEVEADGETIAWGTLSMKTFKEYTGGGPAGGGECNCGEKNTIANTDQDESDGWDFSTGYENGHRTAILKID